MPETWCLLILSISLLQLKESLTGTVSAQVNVSVVNSAGGSFCWDYTTDTSIATMQLTTSDSVNYAGFHFLLQSCRWYFLLQLFWLSFCCSYGGDCSVVSMESEVSAALMQVTVSAAKMWVTIFIVIMQVVTM